VSDVRNVIIIGSGPAGYTAAVYAARANLNPLVIEGAQSGGALMTTTEVENFPGFPDGILGPELMEQMEKQAARFGGELLHQAATRVDFTERPFGVWAGDEEWRARTVIITTGASARWLGVPGEEKLRGRGVSSCATCDGFFFRGQEIVVVGGGDSALEEALFLTRFGTKVTVVHRRDEFRASKIMQDRAFAAEKIEVVWDSVVTEVLGEQSVEAVRLRNVKTDDVADVPTGAMFVAIGHDPNTELFRSQLETNSAGYLVVDEPSTRTSVDGVFAAGDVVDFTYRQAVTAAGMGCKAALDAERFLAAEEHAQAAAAGTVGTER
jgi:thioredoxin reductase (NADPH)